MLRHETRGWQKHSATDPADYSDFKVGDRVMTCDGFAGQVVAVADGLYQQTEAYTVRLDNGMGGGDYQEGQLWKAPARSAARENGEPDLEPVEAGEHVSAAYYYPELGTVLDDRPPIERIRVFAAFVAADTTDEDDPQPEDEEPVEDVDEAEQGAEGADQPDTCSYCGNDSFKDFQDTGRGTRARCAQCGGTMVKPHDGVQWSPEFPNSPENAASRQSDFRSVINDPRAVHSSLGVATGALSAPCETPGAQYSTSVGPDSVGVEVHLPFELPVETKTEAQDLEARMHNGMEAILAPYFVGHTGALTVGALNVAASAEAGYPIFTGLAVPDLPEPHFEFIATWADVRAKAVRIRKEGGVRILAANGTGAVGEVDGDNSIYETEFNYVPGTKRVAYWHCGCPWSAWANKERFDGFKKFQNRPCSHNLALRFEVNARGMFGREVTPDEDRLPGQYQRSPVQVQYQRPDEKYPEGRDLRRRTVPPGNVRTEWGPSSRVRVEGSYDDPATWLGVARLGESGPGTARHGMAGQAGLSPVQASWIGDNPDEPTLHWRAPNLRYEVHIKNYMPSRDLREGYGAVPHQYVSLHENDLHNPHAKPSIRSVENGELRAVDQFGNRPGKPPAHVMRHINDAIDQVRQHADTHADLYGQLAEQQDIRDDLAAVPHRMQQEERGRAMFENLLRSAEERGEHEAALTPAHEWARLYLAAGAGTPATALVALRSLGMAHEAARGVLDYATSSWAACGVLVSGEPDTIIDVDPIAKTAVLYDGRTVDTDLVRYAASHPEGEHLRHRRRHFAPSYAPAYGMAWCPWCLGDGCERCDDNGQVPADSQDAAAGADTGMGGTDGGTTAALQEQPDFGDDLSGGEEDFVGDPADGSGSQQVTGMWHQADYEVGGLAAAGPAPSFRRRTPHSESDNPGSTGFATSADPTNWTSTVASPSNLTNWNASLHTAKQGDEVTHAGVALKAADTGRVLMIQRSNKDEKDPARGTWEFPGGSLEDGDSTSLHGAIREFEEEVGSKFPEGGHLTHVHRNKNYVLHTVVVPEESSINFADGRKTVNPDDPDGDDHEQSAWWQIGDAQKNPALRREVKKTPWDEIKKAANVTSVTLSGGNGVAGTYKPAGRTTAELRSDQEKVLDPDWKTGYTHAIDDQPYQLPDYTPGEGGFMRATRYAQGYSDGRDDQGQKWGVLHDIPEPALPSTDGASEDADDMSIGGDVPSGAQPWQEPDAGLPVDRDEPWGFEQGYPPQGAHLVDADDTSTASDDLSNVPSSTPDITANAVLAQFWKSAGGAALRADVTEGKNSGPAGESTPGRADDITDGDIAATARAVLAKMGAKDFSFAEQRELIDEGLTSNARARNFDDLDLAGTHYAHMADEQDEDLWL